MPPIYLVGGDAYQKLDYPIEAGQTFRVDQPFALHWIDLNLKLSGKRPEALVSLYHADAFHLPSGDPISISRYWLINPPFAPTDWFWHEPWGKTLTENNHWTFLNAPPPVTYQIVNGVITLTNYGHYDIGINFTPLASFPLLDESSKHLHLAINCPYATTNSYSTIIGLGGYFHHPIEGIMHFALYTSIGVEFHNGEDYGADPGPPWPRGWLYIGPGKYHGDILELWQRWRTDLGESTDPTDWTISNFHFALITTVPSCIDRLQNDYLGWYYPTIPNTPPPIATTGFTLPHRLYRVRFSMQEVLLSPDQYYFIRVTAFPGLLEGAHHWQYDNDDATYPQGIRLSTDDGGDTWTKHFDDDHLFAAFGTPPAPTPPPDPPLPNWCILLVTQTPTATGYKITCWTNVPCHLYMFWTNEEPQKHMRTRIVRGLSVLDTPAYCFVHWHQNEQEEAGDTIYHTFIKEPWPECETRWYTFRALVNNEWTTSAAPIFKKHRGAYTEPVLIIEHDPAATGLYSLHLDMWYGNTFIPSYDFYLTKIEVRYNLVGEDPCAQGILRLYETPSAGDELPPLIATSTITLPELPETPDSIFVSFDFDQPLMLKDHTYLFLSQGCSLYYTFPGHGTPRGSEPGKAPTCWRWSYGPPGADPLLAYYSDYSQNHKIWGIPA